MTLDGDVASTWIAYHQWAVEQPKREPGDESSDERAAESERQGFWAWEAVFELVSQRPDDGWSMILRLVQLAPDDRILANGVWGWHTIPEEIQARMRQAWAGDDPYDRSRTQRSAGVR